MSKFGRLITGSIAALAVVAGGATAMTTGPRPSGATAAELASNASRFRAEFALPGANGAAPHQSFSSGAGLKGHRPTTRTAAVRHAGHRLIDGNYPFAAIGWQRSLVSAARSLSQFDAAGQGALSRGCVPCRTAADRRDGVPQG